MPTLTLQIIFRTAFAAFAATRKLPAYMTRAAERIMACRTAALGGENQRKIKGVGSLFRQTTCESLATRLMSQKGAKKTGQV